MSIRMNILVDEKHKKLLKKYAQAINDSESEVIRRALDAYDPTQEAKTEELGLLVRALKEANQRARTALAKAEQEITQTLAYYNERDPKSKRARG